MSMRISSNHRLAMDRLGDRRLLAVMAIDLTQESASSDYASFGTVGDHFVYRQRSKTRF
jgi:hypothetical protein